MSYYTNDSRKNIESQWVKNSRIVRKKTAQKTVFLLLFVNFSDALKGQRIVFKKIQSKKML